MKTFINDLTNELRRNNVPDHLIEEIINDHKEMIEEAIRQGLSEDDIPSRFGDPKGLAKELSEQMMDQEHMSHQHYAGQSSTDDMVLWKEYAAEGDELKVVINSISEDYQIQQSKDDKIRIYYKGREDISLYRVTYQQGELRFEVPKIKGGLIFMRKKHDMDFVFEFPECIKIKECKLNTTSGDLTIKNLTTEVFQLNTTNGDVEVENFSLGNVKINTVNGDFSLRDGKMDSLNVSQVSGDIAMKDVDILGDIHMSTVSGDLEFNKVKANRVEVSSVSGDLKGSDFYPSVIKFKSISGDLSVANSTKTNIHLEKATSVSGRIDIRA